MQIFDQEIALAGSVREQGLDFLQRGRIDLSSFGCGGPPPPAGTGVYFSLGQFRVTHIFTGYSALSSASSTSTSPTTSPLINCFPAFSKLTVTRLPMTDCTWPSPQSGQSG